MRQKYYIATALFMSSVCHRERITSSNKNLWHVALVSESKVHYVISSGSREWMVDVQTDT